MTAGPDDLLSAVAAHGLPGSLLRLPEGPLDDQRWRRLVDETARQRLIGHLAAAVEAALVSTDAQRDEIRALHRRAVGHVLRLEQRLVDVSSKLSAADIPHCTLRGPALARVAYAHSDRRVFDDVDILVPARMLDDVVQLLEEAGCRRDGRRQGDRVAAPSAGGVKLLAPDGLAIDLHRTLIAGPFGIHLDMDTPFETASSLLLGGRLIPALEEEWLLLHICYTTALGGATPLGAFRDLAQLLLHVPIDVDRFLELGRRADVTAVAAAAIATTWHRLQLADLVPLVVWARDYLPSSQERRWLRACRTGTSETFVGATPRSMRGLRGRVAYLRSLISSP